MRDLLADTSDDAHETLTEGAVVLRGFATPEAAALVQAIDTVASVAPFRRMVTPGGHQMSVAMTNCGRLGWVTERSGYRYDAIDPASGRAWPRMPKLFSEMAATAAAVAGFADFQPDACLINRYEPSARMSLHQDRDERDFAQPIVSVSLGLPCRFLFGGLRRGDRPRRIILESGDAVVWADRRAWHFTAWRRSPTVYIRSPVAAVST